MDEFGDPKTLKIAKQTQKSIATVGNSVQKLI
jgi:hypothetical protein